MFIKGKKEPGIAKYKQIKLQFQAHLLGVTHQSGSILVEFVQNIWKKTIFTHLLVLLMNEPHTDLKMITYDSLLRFNIVDQEHSQLTHQSFSRHYGLLTSF